MPEFITQNVYLDYLVRLTACLICGLLLGIERKLRQHTVGVRTLTLISISSGMLSILSTYMASTGVVPGDPTRISAALITGIGFLGAGAIVTQGLNIRGLTSAAITFTAASLGVTCGAGLYVPAFIVLAFSFITLFIINKVEKKLFPAEKRKILCITLTNKDPDEDQIKKLIRKHKIVIHDLDIKYSSEENLMRLIYTVQAPDSLKPLNLINELTNITGIQKIELSKN